MKKMIRSASPKKAKTAGAVKRKKAVTPKRFAVQPENYGYPIKLVRDLKCGFRIRTGCRYFTPALARAHWKRTAARIGLCVQKKCFECNQRQERGRNMLALLPKLKQRARRYGWL